MASPSAAVLSSGKRRGCHSRRLEANLAWMTPAGRVALAYAALLCTTSASTALHAQSDVGAAAALFDKGLKNMLAGRYETGCPQLAESYRLDPEPGALFTLAECRRKQGKIATALAHYNDYMQLFNRMTPDEQAQQRGRDAVSKNQIEALQPEVPRLELRLPKTAPSSTVVKLQGKQFDGPSLGVPLPVDPGTYIVATQVPGGPVHDQTISIKKGERKNLLLEVVAAPAPSAHSGPPAASGAPPSLPPATQGSSAQKTWGYVVGSVGVAGVAVGSVTGILAIGKASTVHNLCPTPNECKPRGKQAADSGKSLALASTIAFGVGAAGLIGGAVLLFTAPSSSPRADSARAGIAPVATVGVRGVWLGAEGHW